MRTAGGQMHAVVTQHIAGGEVRPGLLQRVDEDPEGVGGTTSSPSTKARYCSVTWRSPSSRHPRTASGADDDRPARVVRCIRFADSSGVVAGTVIDQDHLGREFLRYQESRQAGRNSATSWQATTTLSPICSTLAAACDGSGTAHADRTGRVRDTGHPTSHSDRPIRGNGLRHPAGTDMPESSQAWSRHQATLRCESP